MNVHWATAPTNIKSPHKTIGRNCPHSASFSALATYLLVPLVINSWSPCRQMCKNAEATAYTDHRIIMIPLLIMTTIYNWSHNTAMPLKGRLRIFPSQRPYHKTLGHCDFKLKNASTFVVGYWMSLYSLILLVTVWQWRPFSNSFSSTSGLKTASISAKVTQCRHELEHYYSTF